MIRRSLSCSPIEGANAQLLAQFFLTSSVLVQYPTASPARQAAPIAVVSTHCGRITGTLTISACVCIRKSFALAPPSTFSAGIAILESASIAASTSLTWYAMESSVARMIWHLLTPRVMPTIVPRAY